MALFATVTEFGGAERVILSILRNIDKRFYDVVPIVFARRNVLENAFLVELERIGCAYHRINADAHPMKYANPLLNLREAYRALSALRADVIHTHGYRADIIGMVLSKVRRLPMVSTCHGFIANDAHLRLYNRLDRLVLRCADRIVVVSDGLRDDLVSHGIKEARISVIHNAVEPFPNDEVKASQRCTVRRKHGIGEREYAVGFVGRLSREKGVRHLISAQSLLRESRVPSKLVIIGEGPQREELEEYVREEGVEESVVFTGFQKDVGAWLSALDIFVLPSLTEGTPMSLLEAMAAGVPVVASAVGGVPRVIESSRNGMLVSPGNVGELKSAIQTLCEDGRTRKGLSDAGLLTIRSGYGVKGWIARVESEYRECLASRRR